MTKITRGFLLSCSLLLVLSCTAAPNYDGEASTHFDGERFHNRDGADKSAWDLLKFGWGSLFNAASWPDTVAIEPGKVPHARVAQGISVTYINHSTFLIQVDGINILTDPIYAQRASPFQWAGPKRVHQPGVAMADLPPIDVILISHNHYDHLDESTLQELFARQDTPPLILAGLGNGALFSSLGLDNYRDMDWMDSALLGDLEFIFTECMHRSGRGIADQMKTLWGSFVIKTSAGNIYFAGDTGYGPHFAEAGEQLGPFALSLLPIGAYEPRWFMQAVHLNPQDAVQAHQDLRSAQSIGIHYGTFQLTYEAIDQPLIDLQQALLNSNVTAEQFWTLAPGETRTLAAH
jgi:L-ascorbate metabolism protein UlaG (beta-lactamase superfamily)